MRMVPIPGIAVRVAEAAIAAIALLIISNRLQQVNAAKVRPEHSGQIQLGIGSLPQEEVAEAKLTAGADDQVQLRQIARIEMTVDGVLVDIEEVIDAAIISGRVHHGVEGVHDFRSGAVIQRQSEHHAGVVAGFLARPGHAFLNAFRQMPVAADERKPDVIALHQRQFIFQVAMEQLHQEVDLGRGPAQEILRGKGIESQSRKLDARGRLHDVTHGFNSAFVAGDAWQMTTPGPAAIAVHNDGNMPGKLAWIQSAEEFSFLMVQSRRNSKSQMHPLRSYKLA